MWTTIILIWLISYESTVNLTTWFRIKVVLGFFLGAFNVAVIQNLWRVLRGEETKASGTIWSCWLSIPTNSFSPCNQYCRQQRRQKNSNEEISRNINHLQYELSAVKQEPLESGKYSNNSIMFFMIHKGCISAKKIWIENVVVDSISRDIGDGWIVDWK